MKPRGKKIAILATFLGVAVLLISGFAFRERIREEYYLKKLGSDDVSEWMTAVKKLGELRSEKAVPGLLKRMEQGAIPGLITQMDKEIQNALVKIGKPAIKELLLVLSDENKVFAYFSAQTVQTICINTNESLKKCLPEIMKIIDIVPLLNILQNDSNDDVRQAAAEALKKIQGESQ